MRKHEPESIITDTINNKKKKAGSLKREEEKDGEVGGADKKTVNHDRECGSMNKNQSSAEKKKQKLLF